MMSCLDLNLTKVLENHFLPPVLDLKKRCTCSDGSGFERESEITNECCEINCMVVNLMFSFKTHISLEHFRASCTILSSYCHFQALLALFCFGNLHPTSNYFVSCLQI